MKFTKAIQTFSMLALLLATACTPMPSESGSSTKLEIDYTSHTLDNGLEVILHEDKSDPIVAVSIVVHVGSGRELPGRTGFAHLFEHILFGASANVPKGRFDHNIATAGGTLNGGTDDDYTVYFEVVPKNALEMILWMESDRFGFALETLDEQTFLEEKDAVINERRFRYENRPYGLTGEVIGMTLYPPEHPYNWQTIGVPADIRRSTLDDARDFFLRWYGPNNMTLVVAGDIDKDQALKMVEKYFGPIPTGPATEDPSPNYPPLSENRRVYFEDNFATSPELTMVYPTTEGSHVDMYPLDILTELLSGGKDSPLYKVIVEEKKLAPSAAARHSNAEIAGTFRFRVRTFPDVSMSDVEAAIFESLDRFETDGFTDQDLARVKIGIETNSYGGMTNIFSKSYLLALANEIHGSPDEMLADFARYSAVTREDIMRVYRKYVKDQPYVLSSFVPKGRSDLAASNSDLFVYPEFDESTLTETESIPMRSTPTTLDRSIQPPLGPDPQVNLPQIWSGTQPNGIRAYGIKYTELPLVNFSLTIEGGHALESADQYGAASLLSSLLMQGTANRTPVELEKAIDNLGASITVGAGREGITLSGSGLASKFEETFALLKEILLEPRWDEKEFERLKRQTIESINRGNANPATIAWNTFNKLIYEDGNPMGIPVGGTSESVEALTISDLKAFYAANFSPKAAFFNIAGAVDEKRALKALSSINNWTGGAITFKTYDGAQNSAEPGLYFVDVPDAGQTEIRIGRMGVPYADKDYQAGSVMNYRLGAMPESRLESVIRGEKGYTYSARSAFVGRHNAGPFVAYSGVRSDATFDAIVTFNKVIGEYAKGIPEADLNFTKSAMLRSNARAFETLGALMGMLNNISRFNLPLDYVHNNEQLIRDMTLEQHKALAQKFLPLDEMIYIVVGDAATHLESMKELGLGDPIVLEVD